MTTMSDDLRLRLWGARMEELTALLASPHTDELTRSLAQREVESRDAFRNAAVRRMMLSVAAHLNQQHDAREDARQRRA